MTRWVAGLSVVLVLGGCPSQDPGSDDGPVTAKITISATYGDVPLKVAVSAEASSSRNGPITEYRWDFGDGDSSDAISASHTYSKAGRYTLVLSVKDAAGASDTDRIDVRVKGATPTAVIRQTPSSGKAPLSVRFDGTESSAPDDVILDYFWDFGDREQSRNARPTHVFAAPGEYTVTLRVVTGGGAEASTTSSISVGASVGSLQFDGGQLATLPVAASGALTAFTFETWLLAEVEGGVVASFGQPQVRVSADAAAGVVKVQAGENEATAPVSGLAGNWRHVAVVQESGGGLTIYFDGAVVGGEDVNAAATVAQIVLGNGYRGKLARVRLWSTARTASEIAGSMNRTLSGAETGLLGDWSLSEGSGQTLRNRAGGGVDGFRGGTRNEEPSDPAWSSDAP